jgi:hypothetical protein
VCGLHELSDVSEALNASLQENDASIHVCAEVIRHSIQIDIIIPASLTQQGDEQHIVFTEKRVPIELSVLLRKLVGIWDRWLGEREAERESAEKIRGKTSLSGREAQAV